MSKSAVPVEGLYIVAFLILMGLAGMSLYLFVQGQSIASDYRISAASLIEMSESIKRLIDQERTFVMETILYFFGSQSGIENVQEFGDLNYIKFFADNEASACYNILKERMGNVPTEMATRCAFGNPNLFNVNDSAGLWKCDAKMYSYKTCNNISAFAARLCCRKGTFQNNDISSYRSGIINAASGATGSICHQGCMNALEFDYTQKCSNLDYCGGLWCSSDYLEVPETYGGIPYYYKIVEPVSIITSTIEAGPGYYCPSSYSYNPELSYTNSISWTKNLDMDEVINRLISLSNTYFYKPSPQFTSYLNSLLDKNVQFSFQLDFIGCDNEECEFAWVPICGNEQSFIGRGTGGVRMIDFSTNFMSLVTVRVPLQDMVTFAKHLVESGDVKYYITDKFKNITYYLNTQANLNDMQNKGPAYWNYLFGGELGIGCGEAPQEGLGESLTTSIFNYYDNSTCGTDPYHNNCNTECLLSWMNTKLYNATRDPLFYDRPTGYDYTLRPVFRFVDTSLGAVIPGQYLLNGQSFTNNFVALPGKYNIFIRGSGVADVTVRLDGPDYRYTHSTLGDFYDLVNDVGVGRCGQFAGALYPNGTLAASRLDEYENAYGCCPSNQYNQNNNTCNVAVISNTYCAYMHNRFNGTKGGEYCDTRSALALDYPSKAITLSSLNNHIVQVTCNSANCSIDSVDIIRVMYDNSFPTGVYTSQGITYHNGGSLEYYKNTSNCVNPMGSDYISYSALDNTETWLSMLCLRGQGLNWQDIMERETGLYNSFKTKFSTNYKDKAAMIDSFIRTYLPTVSSTNYSDYRVTKVVFRSVTLAPLTTNLYNDSLIADSSLHYGEAGYGLDYAETALERLYQIMRNTSYVSLPMKWVFAYRDVARFNQTLLGEESSCNLNYESVPASFAYPDCSCRMCQYSTVCDFDFSNILVSELVGSFGEFFEPIFHSSYSQYQRAGVVE
ncbi:Uncharacterised protein [Candidatus Tiddalikarchaeum anstoanum]|nr:Uncharacterised protein [Candidatus Tiddalikarchaeum anstoanum]